MRLYLASEMTPWRWSAKSEKLCRGGLGRLTSIGIAREACIPLNIGAVSVSTSSDSVQADGAEDAGVGELWSGGDDAVGDGVIDGLFPVLARLSFNHSNRVARETYAVLLLLDLIDGAVLERPLEDVGLVAGAGDGL